MFVEIKLRKMSSTSTVDDVDDGSGDGEGGGGTAVRQSQSALQRFRRASIAFAQAVDGFVFGSKAEKTGPKLEEKDTYISTTALIGVDTETGAPRFYGDVTKGEIAEDVDVPQRASDEHGRPVGPTRPVALPLLIPRFSRQGRGKVGAAARERALRAFREAPEFESFCRRLELFLGIDVGEEPRYRDIVEEAMVAPLPPGAICFVNLSGDIAFYKAHKGAESTWHHVGFCRCVFCTVIRRGTMPFRAERNRMPT